MTTMHENAVFMLESGNGFLAVWPFKGNNRPVELLWELHANS